MHFHISRAARDRYQFDQSLFQFTGNAIIADLDAAHRFVQRVNAQRSSGFMRASDLYAMGLLDEIAHLVAQLYDEMLKQSRQSGESVFHRALSALTDQFGAETIFQLLRHFVSHFPPPSVYRGEQSADDYLAMHSAEALQEMIMLWLENENPAFRRFEELFDDADLREQTTYLEVMRALEAFFNKQPPFGPDNQPLIAMLRAPAHAAPDSLEEQLRFVQTRWAPYFGAAFERFLQRLLLSFDLIREEHKAALSFGGGPGPARVPSAEELRGLHLSDGGLRVIEYEAFSPDRDWMPRLVLIAKNIYVWLDQLSRKYQRAITRLDQIPDEELDQLARWGFSGLWLIGLWERSRASLRIKQLSGAQDVVASAYSLYDYTIAEDLGGAAALENLKSRAWQRGIRLASDMVPNHMGIDSRWVIEKPDYFLWLPQPPFPSYTFNGPNLCDDPRVEIYLEDHYYTRTDAAVVFKRVDRQTGETRYIYHGNDGTAMPWNDTAQINYLNPEAREAVIQLILRVARQFPIIRFDAAMTLVKRHIKRLWFPSPGEGGAIPSRAGRGVSAEEFERLMPNEFWREVVDRVSAEAPDTLLLAEAFWLLEGYFVRTLGMHRVYNSAFMNMLRDENNAGYRSVIKNTIEFDPEVLRRYVNFLNNPDEKTAVEQFGKGDKYFGVTTLMCTMPGLPMFGHGQIEGFAEKYGMEFRYARWWETPDADLIARHEREIFPLLRQRHLFAGVDHFRLYDFYTENGAVNEDVFAYSNRYGDTRSLVVYHNRFAETRGWIRTSAAFAVKDGEGNKRLVQTTLGEDLGLTDAPDHFVIMRDHVSGLEFLHRSQDLIAQGLFLELRAYERRVFLDIREVAEDAAHPYTALLAQIAGRGVPSVQQALSLLRADPIRQTYRKLISAERLSHPDALLQDTTLLQDAEAVLEAIKALHRSNASTRRALRLLRDDLAALAAIHSETARSNVAHGTHLLMTVAAWVLTRHLGDVLSFADGEALVHRWMREWALDELLRQAFAECGWGEWEAWQASEQVAAMLAYRDALDGDSSEASASWGKVFEDAALRRALNVHRFESDTYFHKEAFELLVQALQVAAQVVAHQTLSAAELVAFTQRQAARAALIAQAAQHAGYRLEEFLKHIEENLTALNRASRADNSAGAPSARK